jgi:hypothetical protein
MDACVSNVLPCVVLCSDDSFFSRWAPRSARGSAAEARGGHPSPSVTGLALDNRCALPPLRPAPDAHPSVLNRHSVALRTTMASDRRGGSGGGRGGSGGSGLRKSRQKGASNVYSELDRLQVTHATKSSGDLLPFTVSLAVSAVLCSAPQTTPSRFANSNLTTA